MEAKIIPYGERVAVVKIEKPAEVVKSGFILPADESDKSGFLRGKIIAVGTIKGNLKIGDEVCLSHYGWDEIDLGKQKVMIVNESNILGVYGN